MREPPSVLTMIDTYNTGGPGKLLLQHLTQGGLRLSRPVVAGFWRGPERPWQFRDAALATGTPFEVLQQRHAFDPSVILAAARLARDRKIEILESHGYKAHVVAWGARMLTGLPWIAFVHGWTSENRKVELYNWIEKKVVRHADRIVPVSESLRQRLELPARLQSRAVTVVNAVEPPAPGAALPDRRAELGLAPEDFVIAVVGRLSPEKGHVHFIDAMAALGARSSSVKALLLGEGQERGRIEARISEQGLGDRIWLVGYQTEIASFYLACDLVCMPSLAEGMPVAALEAMAMGKPVVATQVGGIPEVVVEGETGLLVPARDPEALANAIERIVRDPGLRARLGEGGRRRVEAEFSPRARVERIIGLYRSVLAV